MTTRSDTVDPLPAPSRPKTGRRSAWLRVFTLASAILVGSSGVVALLGWVLNWPSLKSLWQPVPMNPMTAVSFLLSGASLWLLHKPAASTPRVPVARGLAVVIAAVGAMALVELSCGWDSGVDTFLFASRLAGNRIAPNTAVCLLLVGLALMLFDRKDRHGRGPAPLLLLAAGTVALLAVAGYTYAVFGFYALPRFTPMALNSGLTFLVLSAGALCARPDAWPVAAVVRGWSLRKTIAAGYAAALAVVCLIGFVCYQSTSSLIQYAEQDERDMRTLIALEQLMTALADAETGQRGYLLTGDETYLQPYREGIQQVGQHIDNLRTFVDEEPDEQRDLVALEPAVTAKLSELAETITLRREQGLAAALAVVRTDRGRVLMDHVRSRIAAIRRTETEQTTLTDRKKAQLSVRTIRTAVAGAGSAFLIVAGAGFLIRRGMIARERAESELARAKAAAEAASQSKSNFLANMSHEIRTPMAAIIGHADLLLDPEQSPSDRVNSINSIRRSGNHLLGVINDILDLSKIEAEKMTVERVDCDPCRVVGEVASLMRPRAQEKKLAFDVRFETPLPRSILGDPMRLRQVLINLVANAVKFTRSGSVRLVVRLDDAPGQDPVLRFELTDTGVGMTPEQIARIFKPFAQADGSTTREFGGTGLGLTICRRLARLMGGDIEVHSEVGRGSRFTLVLPTGELAGTAMITDPAEAARAGDPGPGRDAAPAPRLTGARILLAEDGPENQVIIAAYLRKAGAEVTIANDGREAVELARSTSFDVILMDMQMPHLDGYGAASKMRSDGLTLPIIALTAHAMSEDRDRCLNAGCTDYLSKPVNRADLVAAVHRHIRQESSAPAASPAPAASRGAVTGDDSPLRSIDTDPVVLQYMPTFLAQLPGHVRAMETLFAERDLAALAKHFHQLKGSGGLYGFPQITSAAAEAERRVAESGPLEAVRRDVEELVRLVRSVEGYEPAKERHSPAGTAERTGGHA